MENCVIEIATTADGKTERFRAKGRLVQEGEGVAVSYEQEGDFVTLRCDSTVFHMERSGEANLACTFCQSERTAMLVSGYGGAGEIPVKTSIYSFQPSKRGYSITLHYDLIFSDHSQSFQLKLKIETSEEK